jgi:subtilisin family serine protease
VDFVAPDGSATSVFAPFLGTSAAAPNAAAAAALMLQANPALSPAQVSSLLARSTVQASGAAGATGAGLIQASTAVQLALATRGTGSATATLATGTLAGGGGGLALAAMDDPAFSQHFTAGLDASSDLSLAQDAFPAGASALALLNRTDPPVLPDAHDRFV